jgi:cytochrome c biogenesis protein CcmG/thiol:disulfide interchange protein DsbE
MRLSAVSATALLVGGLFVGCSTSPRSVSAASVKPDKDRKEAPEFALKDADGKVVKLSDYRGKVVLLDFWATWCGPCKIEIPWFMEMQRTKKDKGFEVLGVAMDDEGWEAVKPFAAKIGMNYRLVIGNDQTAQMYGGVDALPTTFLIDRGGKIAAVHVGLTSRKDIEDGVEQLLQAAPGGITKDVASVGTGPRGAGAPGAR